MNYQEFKKTHGYNICIQTAINNEINKDGIYNSYLRAVINEDYSKALELNQKMYQRVFKIYSESEGDGKKQAKLRLELLAETANAIQLVISNPNYSKEEK